MMKEDGPRYDRSAPPRSAPITETIVPWGHEHREQREALRRHVLLCSIFDDPAIPRPTSLHGLPAGLYQAEAGPPGGFLKKLADWLPRPQDADSIIAFASAMARVLVLLEESKTAHGNLNPETIHWDGPSRRVQLRAWGHGRYLDAIATDVRRLASCVGDLQAVGRILLWLSTDDRRLLAGDLDAGAIGATLGLDVLSRLDARLLTIIRRLLNAGRPDGYAGAVDFQESLTRKEQPGTQAVPGRSGSHWSIPIERIGRSAELASLLDAYGSASIQPNPGDGDPTVVRPVLVTVNGVAGVGKTSVTRAACRSMAARGALVVEGKFNQFGNRQPLSALLNALSQAISITSDSPASASAATRNRIRTHLGSLGTALLPALPPLERIIGPQPPAPELGGEASRTRFELALRRMTAALCCPEAPLVIFVDDVQWADPRSLDLITGLLSEPTISHLLIIAAYRSEAVGTRHPLHAWMARHASGDPHHSRQITMTPWTAQDIDCLLETTGLEASPLRDKATTLLANHCSGNPFGTLQALRICAQEGGIQRLAGQSGWRIDPESLNRSITGASVVELVQRQIRALPEACQASLRDAAHLGPAWAIEVMAAARGCSPTEACRQLAPAVSAGLVQLVDETSAPGQVLVLRFLHDVVQQAAHELVDPRRRQQIRLDLGRRLLAHANATASLEALLFPIVQQFNEVDSRQLLPLERDMLQSLRERAGQVARAQGASRDSLSHFLRAIHDSPSRLWHDAPELLFRLYRQACEAAYLAADFDQAETLLDEAESHSPPPGEVAHLGELRVLVLLARNRLSAAMTVGERTLSHLGMPLLPAPDLANLPPVPQIMDLELGQPAPPVVDGALRILVALTPCAFITSFQAYVRVIHTMIDQAIRWPASALTPLSWTNYGLTLCGTGRPADGFRAGEIALALSRNSADASLRCKVQVLCFGFLRHWKSPASESPGPLLEAYEDCLVCGDQEYLGYAAFLYCDKAWSLRPLHEVISAHAERTRTVRQFGHDFSWKHCLVWLQGMRALNGDGDGPALHLDGPDFSESRDLAALGRANNGFSLFTAHTFRAMLAWHRGDHVAAHSACNEALAFAANGTGTLLLADLYLLCAVVGAGAPDGQPPHRERLAAFSQASALNFSHKLDLLDASQASRQGNLDMGRLLFERARSLAGRAGFLRDQAMAEEGCGEMLLAAGLEAEARTWLEDACTSYLGWGAIAIAERLLQRHTWLQPHAARLTVEPSTLETRLARWLDWAGARRAVLRLLDSGEILVAERMAGEHARIRTETISHQDSALPLAFMESIVGTGEARLLIRPAELPAWRDDPCFATHRPALAWACSFGNSESGQGQAYLECDGPRLLMSPRALERCSRQLADILATYRMQRAEARQARSRFTDAATRLPNRAGFTALLEPALAHARSQPPASAALYLLRPRLSSTEARDFDDDDASPILHELVRRLYQQARHTLTVGRLEHRLFALVFLSRLDRNALLVDARQLLDTLERPFADGRRLLFELAVCADDGHDNASEIIARTERALARASEQGHSLVSADEPVTTRNFGHGSDLVRDLDWALQHWGLRLVFQPIVHMADGCLAGAEALVRWSHPVHGEVRPDIFVDLAERSGLIRYLGRWVTDAFIAQLRSWRDRPESASLSFSFNASPLELIHPDYAGYLLDALARAGLTPAGIILEVTESSCLQDDEHTARNLATLHDAGITLCIDDFGVGMSSLGRLHEMLARRLKIDRSFIEGVAHDSGRQTTVRMINSLAQALQFDVVVEGVSDPEDARFLIGEGLTKAQGFLYARPLEIPDMEAFIRQHACRSPDSAE